MRRVLLTLAAAFGIASPALAQTYDFQPVTDYINTSSASRGRIR